MFNTYFSAKYILEKGALFNFILSDRSDGKTFDCKLRMLEDYEAHRYTTIYIRRYKTEITEKMYNTFFDEVLALEKYDRFNAWHFRASKQGVQVCLTDDYKSKFAHWDWLVYFIPLTMSGKLKSQISVSNIHTIDFDEYIPLDDRYIKNEMELLVEFWKSIDRDRFTTQLIILGNKITAYNPFFDFFNISMQITGEKIRLYKNNTLAVQIYANKEHRKERQKSKFSDLIAGTSYEDYDKGGILNALNLKVASHVGCTYWSSFLTEKGEGSIWSNGRQFIISTYKRKDGFVLVDKMYSIERECYQINFGRFAQLFKRLYKSGQLYFEDEKSYHIFEDILHKIWN